VSALSAGRESTSRTSVLPLTLEKPEERLPRGGQYMSSKCQALPGALRPENYSGFMKGKVRSEIPNEPTQQETMKQNDCSKKTNKPTQ
jgi:hypothetical protein